MLLSNCSDPEMLGFVFCFFFLENPFNLGDNPLYKGQISPVPRHFVESRLYIIFFLNQFKGNDPTSIG